MATVAIIDDRRLFRETHSKVLRALLRKRIEVIDSAPLPKLSDYPGWLSEHEVAALVVDERLNEQARDSEGTVDYNGHNLVDSIRSLQPLFPIFVLTAHADDEPLKSRLGKVEEVISKRMFNEDASTYAQRVERAALRYDSYFQELLAEFGKLASKLANGTADEEDKKRAEAIRTMLGIAYPLDPLGDRSALLGRLERAVHRIGAVVTRIESKQPAARATHRANTKRQKPQ